MNKKKAINKAPTKLNTNIKKNNNKNNKEKNNNKKDKFSKRHPKLSLAIKITILLTILAVIVGAGIVVGMIYGMWGQDFEINIDELVIKGNSIVYDSEGNVRAELSGDENRKIIKLEDMAEYLPKAYVAIEDERFYDHQGVDFKRTAGAIGSYIIHRGSSNYGGSTITQQLVKNMTNAKDRSGWEGITRKVKEWAKAYQIERMLSKDQILELYLNIIFVGDARYGVQVGAEYYFNKDAKDLSLEECAFMAGINSGPNLYNPYGKTVYGEDESKTNLVNKKTKTVLGKMLELGYIQQDEYDKASEKVNEGLKFKKGNQDSKIYSYHIDATISAVINDFVEEKGWTKDYATTYVYGGGLKIYSTEQPSVQEKIEEVMADNYKKYQISTKNDKKEKVYSQSAMVVVDNETGYVAGIVGGLGEKTTSRGLNRATQSTRSTGSSIKPLAELIPGIQEGIITPSTRYYDVKTEFDNGRYVPTNEGAYTGSVMSVRQATAKSQNVPFVKMAAEITVPVMKDYLSKLGITTIENDNGLSLALGGLENGITPLEMAGAYATIANNGVYRTPLLYTKVVNSEGVTELEPKQETRTVCSEQTAYVVKDLLTSVVESGGTAPYCKISGIDVAAKTGTTNSKKDRWLCGFTNYYTGATWYGYDGGEKVNYSGTNPAGQIWSATMKSLHAKKKNSKFEEPSGIVTARVCKNTGLKSTSKCEDTYSEIFVEGNIPEACDENGSAVEICEDSELLANEYCPNVETIYSYTLPKEKLKLWKSYIKHNELPTKMCTEHSKETQKENANAPKIKLIGDSTINLKVGENYIEKGATATDDNDGDITNKIQISGSVNTSKAGTYKITYKVKNSFDKETTTTRTVIVKAKEAAPTSTPVPTKAPTPTPTPTPTENKPKENDDDSSNT